VKRILDEKIERNLANVIASVEMSGTIFPAWEIELLRQYAYGEITEAEFLEIGKAGKTATVGKAYANERHSFTLNKG